MTAGYLMEIKRHGLRLKTLIKNTLEFAEKGMASLTALKAYKVPLSLAAELMTECFHVSYTSAAA